MSGFDSYLEQDRRLAILRLLNRMPNRSLNASVLQTALEQVAGHAVSRDRIYADLDWLAEQGLVVTRDVQDLIRLAELTQRGFDVAEGRTVVSGVKRPAPGSRE